MPGFQNQLYVPEWKNEGGTTHVARKKSKLYGILGGLIVVGRGETLILIYVFRSHAHYE